MEGCFLFAFKTEGQQESKATKTAEGQRATRMEEAAKRGDFLSFTSVSWPSML